MPVLGSDMDDIFETFSGCEEEIRLKEYSEPSHIQITPMKDDKWGWVVWYSFGEGDSPKDAEGIEDTLNEAINKINLVVTGKYVKETT